MFFRLNVLKDMNLINNVKDAFDDVELWGSKPKIFSKWIKLFRQCQKFKKIFHKKLNSVGVQKLLNVQKVLIIFKTGKSHVYKLGKFHCF